MSTVYEELEDTSRRQILGCLMKGSKTVNEIVRDTSLKQPNVSNHLRRMRSRDIVRFVKRGRQVMYSLASPEVGSLVDAVLTVKSGVTESLNYVRLVESYYLASIQGDEEGALAIVEEALGAKAPLLDIYDKLLAPSMRRVGDCYGEGELDEGQEHLASEITLRMLTRAVRVPGPSKAVGLTCIAGCVPNDGHVIGPRMASDYLKLSGWRSLFCGGNVPIKSFLSAVYRYKPELAIIGLGISDGVEDAMRLIKGLRHLCDDKERLSICLGGEYAVRNAEGLMQCGADFICGDIRQFAQQIVPRVEAAAKSEGSGAAGQS